MSNSQCRFSKDRAGQTHLIFCNEVINPVDEGEVQMLYMLVYK